jgi:6,7-dimethyl-8-ribityllumazine synthase
MAKRQRILIVESRFYGDIADELAKGAVEALDKADVGHERLGVPGTFEIPAAIRFAIRSMEVRSAPMGYAGFIALGCVIRGETDHYEHICRETSRALMDMTINYSVAIGFGVLTCETRQQATVRAAVDQMNKGGDAASACLAMLDIKKKLRLTLQ